LLRDDTYAAARAALAAQCGEALAQIHRIDPGVAPGLDRSDRLLRFRGVLDLLGDPHPTFELALRWLEANRPPAGTPTVVHGDFRLGNLLAAGPDIAAVVDWEIWTVGDPRVDVGWFLVNADPDTYRRATRYTDTLPSTADLFDDYVRAFGGDSPDTPWFEALACFKSTATWSLIVKHNRRRDDPDADVESVAAVLPHLLDRARALTR